MRVVLDLARFVRNMAATLDVIVITFIAGGQKMHLIYFKALLDLPFLFYSQCLFQEPF